ncbi:5,10-methylenetetrahydrofolate reductase [Chitinivibrio alkaliphilus ACht1]|uniref:Methylenetetrahydrofolate reductase n=1 Tax=Chitinivibrio alkaliphilus ACht1 TaxID=1313304 RepID=U7D5B2_9BACT|nr:5,10-methylenetetrahydrofolate reductase [Chitinivibrio alkaliphilus ACht1]
MFNTITQLQDFNPDHVSVTYGAGGTTRSKTHDLVCEIQKKTNLSVVSHLTCVGHSRQEIRELLQDYSQSGIENILALRGDPPHGGANFIPAQDGFAYAEELVAFIRQEFPHMGIGVAGFPEGHPACPNRLKEIEYLKRKVDAGADYICTQLFFDNRDFYDFRERCELAGITVPILAGLMPITSLANMRKISELALGSRIPAKLLKSIHRSEEYVENIGIHWAAEQVNDLLEEGVKGIHFYTLNKAEQIQRICSSIGIVDSDQLNT